MSIKSQQAGSIKSLKAETPKKPTARAKAECCIKYASLMFDCVVLGCGITLVLLLLFTYYNTKVSDALEHLLHSSRVTSQAVQCFFMVLGVCIAAAFSGLLGISATACYNYTCMILFLIFLAATFMSQISAVVAVAMQIPQSKALIHDALAKIMSEYHNHSASHSLTNESMYEYVVELEKELACSRICPKSGKSTSAVAAPTKISCCDAVGTFIQTRLDVATVLFTVAMLFELLTFIFSILLLPYARYEEVHRGRVTFILDRDVETERLSQAGKKYSRRYAKKYKKLYAKRYSKLYVKKTPQ